MLIANFTSGATAVFHRLLTGLTSPVVRTMLLIRSLSAFRRICADTSSTLVAYVLDVSNRNPGRSAARSEGDVGKFHRAWSVVTLSLVCIVNRTGRGQRRHKTTGPQCNCKKKHHNAILVLSEMLHCSFLSDTEACDVFHPCT